MYYYQVKRLRKFNDKRLDIISDCANIGLGGNIMFITEWNDTVKRMTTRDLEHRLAALDALQSWQEFNKEFEEFGIFNLSKLIRSELQSRE